MSVNYGATASGLAHTVDTVWERGGAREEVCHENINTEGERERERWKWKGNGNGVSPTVSESSPFL